MLTVCPKCTLTLAVTATDLRTGQGYVRCGRCATVFNALVALSEESGGDAGSTQPNPALTHPEESANDAAPLQHSLSESDLVESTGTGTVETIVLEGDGATQTEEFVDIGTIDNEIAAATRRHFEEALGSVMPEPEVVTTLQRPRGADTGVDAGEVAHRDPPTEMPSDELPRAAIHDLEPAISPPHGSLLWGALASLLLLLLAAQAVHHWRNDLATSPGGYAALSKPYRLLGLTLTPNWDLQAYDLRQLGAAAGAESNNAIRVHISLANRAARAQPFPVLRLSLFNRYGKRVAVHDLQPREYLRDAATGQNFMKVSQSIDAEVGVPDAGPDASSFELDVCVAAASGLRCASDEPLRSVAHS